MKPVTNNKGPRKDIQNLTKKELKKAIIMSEILGKPKALKKRSL